MAKISDDLLSLIDTLSRRHGVDPNLTYAIMAVESTFNPKAKSKKGAKGLMQLSPLIAKVFALSDPYDPYQNIDVGVRYLSHLLSTYQDEEKALAHYYGGTKFAKRPERARKYLKKVEKWRQQSPFPLLPKETRFIR